MAETKKTTNGYFDFVGMIKGYGTESFKKDLVGTNNTNWLYNRLSLMLTDGKGKNIYVNMQDGYDRVNGKTIYAQSEEGNQMQVAFADRFNETLRNSINDKSFLKVATGKVTVEAKDYNTGEVIMENGSPKMIEVWDYKRFLTLYDLTNFLSDKLTDGLKVRITGQIRYKEYQDETQRELIVQRVYFLPEGDETECEFAFTQTVILDSESVNTDSLEKENMAILKAKIYQKKNKDEMMVLPLDLIIRTTPEKIESTKKMIDMLYRVSGDTLRSITLLGVINSGYIKTDATVDAIPPEMQELIDAGVFTEEDILQSYSKKEKVDEMLIVKPAIKDGKIVQDDKYYVKADFENLKIQKSTNENVSESTSTPVSTSHETTTDGFLDLDKALGLA